MQDTIEWISLLQEIHPIWAVFLAICAQYFLISKGYIERVKTKYFSIHLREKKHKVSNSFLLENYKIMNKLSSEIYIWVTKIIQENHINSKTDEEFVSYADNKIECDLIPNLSEHWSEEDLSYLRIDLRTFLDNLYHRAKYKTEEFEAEKTRLLNKFIGLKNIKEITQIQDECFILESEKFKSLLDYSKYNINLICETLIKKRLSE